MRIRIVDIPPEGRELTFDLDRATLNSRVQLVDRHRDRRDLGGEPLAPPSYIFDTDPHVRMRLELEGSTVVIKGEVTASYCTICSRCAEEAKKSLTVPLDLVLKPRSARSAAPGVGGEEDLHFGYYENEEVDCDSFGEEFLVLGLPFTVLCRPDCRGLCSRCGKNLNDGPCDCPPEERGDPRLQILRQLKIQ